MIRNLPREPISRASRRSPTPVSYLSQALLTEVMAESAQVPDPFAKQDAEDVATWLRTAGVSEDVCRVFEGEVLFCVVLNHCRVV